MHAELYLSHEIDHSPTPEDAQTFIFKVYTSIVTSGSFHFRLNFVFSWKLFDVLSVYECGLRKLRNLFSEAGLTNGFSDHAIGQLSSFFFNLLKSLGCFIGNAISVYMYVTVRPPQIEEATQASFNDESTHNIRSRPASKLEVGSLARKVYKANKETLSSDFIVCTICLEEFTDGAALVTLPCGHEFDDRCIVEWFGTSHVCPLCRFELPCENMTVRRELVFGRSNN